MANKLAELFPHLVHIEEKAFTYPSYVKIADLFWNNYNLSANYCLHIFQKEVFYIPDNIEDLDGYNCTLGVAMRIVLYDSGQLRRKDNITVGYRLKGKNQIREKFSDHI